MGPVSVTEGIRVLRLCRYLPDFSKVSPTFRLALKWKATNMAAPT